MSRKFFSATVLATLLGLSSLAGGFAYAQGRTASPTPQVTLSASQALLAAEQHLPNSKAVEVELDREDGRIVYEVKLLSGQSRHKVLHNRFDVKVVDAASGKVLSVGEKTADARDADKVKDLLVTPAQAATTAEQLYPGGKAVEVELEHKRDQRYYEVKVLTSQQQKHEVKVDAMTGKVLSAEKKR